MSAVLVSLTAIVLAVWWASLYMVAAHLLGWPS